MPKRDRNPRCDNCSRRIGGSWIGIRRDGVQFNFCGNRRACRRACREESARSGELVVMPPAYDCDIETGSYGAALAGFDYVKLPWWMEWMPDAWLEGLRREVAVKVGGIVERRCFMKVNAMEDGDD